MMWLPLLILALTLAYFYMLRVGGHWSRRNAPGTSSSEFLGNLISSITMKEGFGGFLDKLYKRFRSFPYFGAFTFQKPVLVLVELDMVKTVLMTEFLSFQRNGIEINEAMDPLFATNPFVQGGNEWKRSRTQITPAFTSGRMKAILPLMLEIGDRMTTHISEKKEALEAKLLSEKFAMDNVASCAFGLDAEAFTNPNSDFLRKGKTLFEPSTLNLIKFTIAFLLPELTKILRIRFIPKDTSDWMEGVINETVKHRESKKVSRDDFLQGMMNLKQKNQSEHPFSNLEMAGHCLSFLTDGYETSSGALAFALYEVANNKDVQDNLRREIEDTLKNHNGDITYDAIMEMSYLEMVLFETLRKHPPVMFSQKRCTKECSLPAAASGFKDLVMRPGDSVLIPIFSIHRDPEHYPDPEKFIPERFTEDEKSSRHPCAFLGFGGGPRMCLGMRFAILQMKVALIKAVRKFELSVSSKTIEPIKLETKSLLYQAKGGLWINFKPI